VDPAIVYVDVPAGKKSAVFDLTAQEIAKLINRPVQDVDGATVLVTVDSDSSQSFTLARDKLTLSVDVTSSSVLVKLEVDLSTAKDDFPSDVSSWVIRPALRMIRVQAGPAKTAFLNVPSKFASGSPASLSVGVVDESGRLVKRPYSVSFIDAECNDIDTIDAERGIARYQYVPEPTRPIIKSVKPKKLGLDGKELPGLTIAGTGFSVDAKVSVADVPISEESNINVKSPEEILVALPNGITSGSVEVIVENPDGLRSTAISVEL
jgi:hypothetical protein